MARINLLPWREEQRKERQRQFLLNLGMALVAAVVIVLLWNSFEGSRISLQNSRNEMLQSEIREMDVRIEEIARLELIRNNLLERKEVIESLQGERSATVMMLDELVLTTPIGVTLKSLRQQGNIITIIGTTQSNARVSAYLASLETSELFVNPQLQIIQAGEDRQNAVEPYDFTLHVRLSRDQDDSDEMLEEIS